MAQNISYFKNSWRQLTAAKGWIKAVLLLALARFIPIAGDMATYGYGYEWARNAAWKIQGPPKTSGISVGKIMRTGALQWVFLFVFGIVVSIATSIIYAGTSWIPVINVIVSLLVFIVTLFIQEFAFVSAMRGVIYDGLAPSFQVHKAYDLVSRDWNGFLRVALIYIIGGLITGVAIFIALIPVIFTIIMPLAMGASALSSFPSTDAGYEFQSAIAGAGIFGSIGLTILLVFILAYLATAISTVVNLLTIHATGTWISQFNPESWGPYDQQAPTVQQQAVNYNYQDPTATPAPQANVGSSVATTAAGATAAPAAESADANAVQTPQETSTPVPSSEESPIVTETFPVEPGDEGVDTEDQVQVTQEQAFGEEGSAVDEVVEGPEVQAETQNISESFSADAEVPVSESSEDVEVVEPGEDDDIQIISEEPNRSDE